MADIESPPPERRQRKSVAFAEGETLIDGNGDISTLANGTTGDKQSAESHSQPNGDVAIDDATQSFDDLALAKKKKKSKKKEADKAAEDGGADAAAPATAEDELDLGALKKKKKKAKAAKAEDTDDFDAKLAQAGGVEKDTGGAEADAGGELALEDAGDMEQGTGVWAHDSSQPINYPLLLSRFFKLLNTHNPDLMSSGGKSYKIPPPQCLREGNKKTIFANIAEICRRMKRSDEHVTQFLFAELGTTGSVDGSRRLVIKGKFLQKQIENVLRRYIVEYVSCKTCKSPDTELVRGENRLLFIECNSCASRRSVQSIKTGFTAQVGKRRRQQG